MYILQQFISHRNMSELLQGRLTTSNANTWVDNSYSTILYRTRKNRYVLSRFSTVDGVIAVWMSRGKLSHAVGPATQNARLSSWRVVRGTRRSPRAAERSVALLNSTLKRQLSTNPSHQSAFVDLDCCSAVFFCFSLSSLSQLINQDMFNV